MRISNPIALGVLVAVSGLFGMEARTSVSLPEYPRFNELQKITVGPDDQLDASYNPKQKHLVFTHRANMISHLRMQDLSSGEVRDLLPADADSVQAKFNVRGQIVFVYYKNNSRGDICYTDVIPEFKKLPLTTSSLHCLARPPEKMRTERSQPFWIGQDQIGFLEKTGKGVSLFAANLANGKVVESLVVGETIMAPYATPDGQHLVFTQQVKTGNQLVLLDRKSGASFALTLVLPGVTGFASLTDDGAYIYFSHFIGDSNQDTFIDGKDNSVVWRVATDQFRKVAGAKEVNPDLLVLEQITPMDLNCSFPVLEQEKLFLTCAFEGSLDIYQLAKEGVVPQAWNEEVLKNAIMTARSYQDRILLVNALKARTLDPSQRQQLDERLFNLHWLADEVSAATFYSKNLNSVESLKIVLKARLLKKRQPTAFRTALFRESLQNLQVALAKVKGEESLKMFARAYLQGLGGQRTDLGSLRRVLSRDLKGAPGNQTLFMQISPIHYWLYYGATEELYSKRLEVGVPSRQSQELLKVWLDVLKVMTHAPSLSRESRLYYALELIELVEPLDLKARMQTLENFAAGFAEESEVKVVLQAEIYSLELIQRTEKKEKLLALQKLDRLMQKYKTDYFVRKAINVRAVLNFLQHQQFQQMGIIASNWLRDTPGASTEFSYARDVVISAAREQAYAHWTKPNPRLASDYFFQSLSLTDDLESYSGYVYTMNEIGQRKEMVERLEYLRQHEVMRDGVFFVKALSSLLDGEDEKKLESALDDLVNIRVELVDPMRTLVMGYIYLEKFRNSRKGIEFDRELWQKAHQNLILTADLARGRSRVRAAALSNLGLLHLWGQNYHQSIRFFEMRKQLGFDEATMRSERQAFAWFYSQALFLAGQPKQAATELAEFSEHEKVSEIVERKAFYLSMAGQFGEALESYEVLQKKTGELFESLKEPSRTKVRLGLAYTLFSANKPNEAKRVFERIVKQPLERFDNSSGERVIAFDPKEIRALSWGFLAQMGTDNEKIKALRSRLEMLDGQDLSAAIQAKLQLAERLSLTNSVESTQFMRSALAECRVFAADNGPMGQTVFRTLSNYMVFGLLFRTQYVGEKHGDLRDQLDKTLTALARETETSTPPILLEQWRLRFLWGLFQEKILHQVSGGAWREDLNRAPLTDRLRTEAPEAFLAMQAELSVLEKE